MINFKTNHEVWMFNFVKGFISILKGISLIKLKLEKVKEKNKFKGLTVVINYLYLMFKSSITKAHIWSEATCKVTQLKFRNYFYLIFCINLHSTYVSLVDVTLKFK